ncbi:hypothetical protein DN402_32710 [Streptomyces sp. SW4]|nr:hypothetical protein DN402_32710 [Streptomyces sp. SW4]
MIMLGRMTTARRATADVLGAALELRRAARDAARGTGGADAVLAALSGLVAHDFASLARWDPLRRRHLTLVGTYPAAATAYIETRLHDDPSFAAVRRSPDGVRWWQDVPEPERHASPASARCSARWVSGAVSRSACSRRTAGTSGC